MKKQPYAIISAGTLAVFPFSFLGAIAQGDQDYVRTTPSNNFTSGDKKFNINVSIGAAIPMGDFGSTNVSNSFWDFNSPDSVRLQGFAQPGLHFDLSLTYFISDYFGITAMVGGNSNEFDLNAFSATMRLPATATTTSYYTGEYLIGPVFCFNMGSKWKINATILGGFAQNNYPQLTLAFNDTVDYTRAINNGRFSFAFSVGAGISYSITDNLDLSFNMSYMGTTILYPNWIETLQINSPNPAYYYLPIITNHTNNQTSMETGILKPTIGITVKF